MNNTKIIGFPNPGVLWPIFSNPQCLDGIKSTVKLQSLGESLPELCPDEQHTDLCRCLHKLHFQLSLLYETYAKLILALLHAARTSQVRMSLSVMLRST